MSNSVEAAPAPDVVRASEAGTKYVGLTETVVVSRLLRSALEVEKRRSSENPPPQSERCP